MTRSRDLAGLAANAHATDAREALQEELGKGGGRRRTRHRKRRRHTRRRKRRTRRKRRKRRPQRLQTHVALCPNIESDVCMYVMHVCMYVMSCM